MIDEKAIPLEAITAAEVELARVLKGFDYCMPADGMQRVLTAALSALRPGSTGETEGWRELMKELADDLECELQARYPEEARAYPSQAMKFYADMEPVRRARAMLAAAGGN